MRRNKSSIWFFLYIFFLLFGPKIGGYLDTSALAGLIIIFLHVAKERTIRIPLKIGWLAACIFLLAFYEVLVGSIYGNVLDITFIGRMIRSCIALISIYIFVEDYYLDNKSIIYDSLVGVLFIHAVFIILSSTLFLSWQELLRPFTAYAAHVRMYRSTGLMAGFDMAGVLCVIGVALVISKQKLRAIDYISFAVFSTAAFFTSRFTLVYLGIVLLSYLLINRKSKEKMLLRVMITIFLAFAALFAIVLFSSTTSNIIRFTYSLPSSLSWIANLATKVQLAYAKSDIVTAYSKNNDLPKSWGLVFGEGVYGGGDIGYVRIINAIGVIGLIIIIAWHLDVFISCYKKTFDDSQKNQFKNFMMITFLFVLVFLNFKNSYFFTGTFFEIFLLVSFCIDKDRQTESCATNFYEKV